MSSTPRRRKHSVELPTNYVVNILRWNWSYSFGLNPVRRESDPFMEFRHLTVSGVLMLPQRHEDEKVELMVIPDQDLNASVRRQRVEKPLAVGSLGRSRGFSILQGYLSLPQDVLHTLLSMLVADRLKFVLLNGTRIGRGGARISSYRFCEVLRDDDLYESES